MYYEINVALNGTHFFATAKRSIQCEATLKKVLPIIKTKFPETEGFNIMVSEHPETGFILDVNELLKNL